jgi:pyruvate dehydrogenase E2 component (dihydrolipoamide acetyltransferase)
MTVFALPDLGEGLHEAEIVAWHVSEGDHVVADQPLLSVETDKAVVEIPAPSAGTVTRLIAAVGDIVPTGAPLAEIGTGAARDAGAIVGDLAGTPKKAPPPAAPPATPAAPKTAARATPAIRKLARERGVDLAGIAGSGPGGAIVSHDVIAAADRPGPGEALRGTRRAMARAMTESHASVVPATLMDHAVIDRWGHDEDPTLRLIHAMALACAAEPALNAWFDGERRQLHDHVDLAIAMDTPDGLFTPVLRDVAQEPDLAGRLAALKAAVRDRTISREAMQDATITLSNFGMIGGEHAVLVVSPPQVAILGAGRITDRTVVEAGRPAARQVMPLSLTFDHRVVTGGEAARFLDAIRADLEKRVTDEKG